MANSDTSWYRVVLGVALVATLSVGGNWEAFKAGRVCRLIGNLSAPHSGEEELLSKGVQGTLTYLREHGVHSVRVSPGIANNRYLFHPLVEALYPIRINNISAVLVLHSSEAAPAGCTTLKLEEGIRIVDCR